ncbi:uncharacterized protein LOC135135671 [Zophobas morio]|uniref:uncharacterized protein LOC135135671 n=1 Tax=Zophobas morio TaxID=2755281 RepID=UPI003082EA52
MDEEIEHKDNKINVLEQELKDVNSYDEEKINALLNKHPVIMYNNKERAKRMSENVSCIVSSAESSLVPEDVHHPSLLIEILIETESKVKLLGNQSCTKYNFRKANFQELYNAFCSLDWSYLEKIRDVEIAVDGFYDKIYQLFDNYVPKCPITTSKFPIWFTRDIIVCIREKQRYLKLYKKFKFALYKDKVSNLRKIIRKKTREEYQKFLKVAEDTIQTDPKNLWKFIDNKRNASRIPGNMTYEDESLISAEDIVNGFARHFRNVYHRDSKCVCDVNCDEWTFCDICKMKTSNCVLINCDKTNCDIFSNAQNVLHNFKITCDDIYAVGRKLKNTHTMGPDNIPSFLVRDCLPCFVRPLLYIFNLIINTAHFPKKWKFSRVCSVFKSGSKNDVSNYRPINLLNNFAKLFEGVIAKVIFSHVSGMIAQQQHGFVKGRSTVTNLCEFVQYVSNALDNKKQVDVIYTDLSKAFDRVDHCVTQGSNLGPLLFLMFVNDIVKVLKSGEFQSSKFTELLPILSHRGHTFLLIEKYDFKFVKVDAKMTHLSP